MIIVTYDISDDKLRTRFSKFLEKYGRRLQYSVFEIRNSDRILNIIISNLNGRFAKKFRQTDSVIIFRLKAGHEVLKFGYAANDDKDLIII
jgi:CRISPR-associated protein Cas2